MVSAVSELTGAIGFRDARVLLRQDLMLGPLNWLIEPNQKWLIVGRNGAGKSALVAALQGEGERISGDIWYNDDEAAVVSTEIQKTLLEEERIRCEGQDERISGTPVSAVLRALSPDEAELSRFVQRLGLSGRETQPFRSLSTGETRKVLLARALASNRSLLILDEPASGLDAESLERLHQILEDVKDRTVLLLSNDWSRLPSWIDHVALVDAGELVFCGPLAGADIEPWLAQMMALSDRAGHLPEAAASDLPALDDDAPLVDMRQIHVAYGDRVVLTQFDWRIESGQHWQVTGANGSGKTTLLELITGDSPHCYTNDLTVFGYKRGTGESIWQIKQYIGLVSSALHMAYRVSSSLENVLVSGFFDSIGVYQKPSEAQRQIVGAWLQRLGLDAVRQQPFNQQSYGNQRLLLIARAMIKQPALLILDEPCLGLDAPNRALVLALIEQLIARAQTTVIYVSHDARDRVDSISNTLALS